MDTDFSNCLTATQNMRVPFHDIDPAGVAWHGRYFKYFEFVRCDLLEKLNYSYQGMTDSGYLWPVVDTRVRYVRPLTLDQRFVVIACLREWELRLVLDYKIEDEKGELFTRAQTVQVPVSADTLELQIGSPKVLIEAVQDRLQTLA